MADRECPLIIVASGPLVARNSAGRGDQLTSRVADDLFGVRESSRPSDVLRLVVELLWPSVNVHRRPLAVGAIITQLTVFVQRRPGLLLAVPLTQSTGWLALQPRAG